MKCLVVTVMILLSIPVGAQTVVFAPNGGCRRNLPDTMRLSNSGNEMPEDGVYVLRPIYEQNPEAVRKFVEASKKGWSDVASHEAGALKITLAEAQKNQISTNEYHRYQMLKEILCLKINAETEVCSCHLSRKSFQSAVSFILPGC